MARSEERAIVAEARMARCEELAVVAEARMARSEERADVAEARMAAAIQALQAQPHFLTCVRSHLNCCHCMAHLASCPVTLAMSRRPVYRHRMDLLRPLQRLLPVARRGGVSLLLFGAGPDGPRRGAGR